MNKLIGLRKCAQAWMQHRNSRFLKLAICTSGAAPILRTTYFFTLHYFFNLFYFFQYLIIWIKNQCSAKQKAVPNSDFLKKDMFLVLVQPPKYRQPIPDITIFDACALTQNFDLMRRILAQAATLIRIVFINTKNNQTANFLSEVTVA